MLIRSEAFGFAFKDFKKTLIKGLQCFSYIVHWDKNVDQFLGIFEGLSFGRVISNSKEGSLVQFGLE